MGVSAKKARNLLQQEPGRVCHQADADDSLKVTQTRPQRQHHETADNYVRVLVRLDQNWRVIECKDRIQWILQRRDAVRSGQTRWKGVRYFRTRKALIRASRALCGPLCLNEAAVLIALPDRIGGVE